MINQTIALIGLTLSLGANAASTTVTGNIYNDGSGSTVDHWGFTANSAGTVSIDTLSWERNESGQMIDVNGDGEFAYFDTYIYLFRDDGSLDTADFIIKNDDSSETFGDGSIYNYDAYLSTSLAAGDYILAIGAYSLSESDAIDGFNDGNSYPRSCLALDAGGLCTNNVNNYDYGDYAISFTGDLEVSQVPIPAAVWLFGSALFGLGIVKHKKA